jgi:hypothetical protein
MVYLRHDAQYHGRRGLARNRVLNKKKRILQLTTKTQHGISAGKRGDVYKQASSTTRL